MGSGEGGEKKALGWAARDPSGVLSPYSYTLRFYFIYSLFSLYIKGSLLLL